MLKSFGPFILRGLLDLTHPFASGPPLSAGQRMAPVTCAAAREGAVIRSKEASELPFRSTKSKYQSPAQLRSTRTIPVGEGTPKRKIDFVDAATGDSRGKMHAGASIPAFRSVGCLRQSPWQFLQCRS